MAFAAYAQAILTGQDQSGQVGGFGLPVAAGWLGALAASGLVALFVGAAALRLRHDYLAITAFGVAVTIQLVALNAEALTGGAFGLNFIPRPFYATMGDPTAWNVLYLAILAALTALVYLALERLARSPFGRVLRAIREDETAAAALGKHAFIFRLQAFVIGATIMGLAGAVYAHFIGFIAPENFLPILTFQAWAMLIVGGSGNNRGAILGAVLVWAVWALSGAVMDQVLPPAMKVRGAALQVVLIGVAIAAMLVLRPRGLLGEEVVVSRHAAMEGEDRV